MSAGNTGAKRGRKPRGTVIMSLSHSAGSPLPSDVHHSPSTSTSTPQQVRWSLPEEQISRSSTPSGGDSLLSGGSIAARQRPPSTVSSTDYTMASSVPVLDMTGLLSLDNDDNAPATPTPGPSIPPAPLPSMMFPLATAAAAAAAATNHYSRPLSMPPPASIPIRMQQPGAEEDGEGDDELFPAMADDDYSAQQTWNSQSKDNLKVLMDHFSPEQYERFEAYRRHALPKQAVRKVIQTTVGTQVSQPVAQIVAGFAKVFVGEVVEKAREVQARRGESGPLSPDHLREAYRMYQEESGRVGAARPLRGKKLFVR